MSVVEATSRILFVSHALVYRSQINKINVDNLSNKCLLTY